MKKGIWKFWGILVLAGAIGFSFIQLSTPVSEASGCPANPYPECTCTLIEGTYVQHGDEGHWFCRYWCSCFVPGSNEHFEIERTEEFPN
jgi:hypothetical protein